MRIQYVVSWVGFIALGFILAWVIAIGLYSYGKDTIENKKKEKGLLNMSYQKFIFWWGAIWGDIFIVALLIGLLKDLITGIWS